MRTQCKRILSPLLALLLPLILWEALVRIAKPEPYVLPSPTSVLTALVREMPTLLPHTLVTLSETVLGLLIAVAAALVLSILMDTFETFKMAIYPILIVSQTIPVIVLAPIFIIWMGFGMAPKILTVVLMCFFPAVTSLTDGMAQVDVNQINLVRSYGAGYIQVYTLIKLPAASASLFSGLRVSATYSVTAAVVGEWMSSQQGLGYYFLRVKNAYMLDRVFACVVVIILLSLLMTGVIQLIQYLLFPHLRRERALRRAAS